MNNPSDPNELFDVVNNDDEVIGTAKRHEVHEQGLYHRGVHVWLYTDEKELIFEKRSMTKDLYPGKLNATVGGHVSSGETYIETAVRELEEESGVVASGDELYFLTKFLSQNIDEQTGLIDNEFLSVYILPFHGSLSDLRIEPGEKTGFEKFSIHELEAMPEEDKHKFIQELFEKDLPFLINYLKSL